MADTDTLTAARPSSDIDPFSRENILDPYAWHQSLHDAGPLVWMTKYGVWGTARYDIAKQVLDDWETYGSGAGVGLSNFHTEKPWRPPSKLLEADPPELLQQGLGPDDARLLHSSHHLGNFYASVRSRKPPICPAEVGHRTATVCHLGNIAMALGRPLDWDPVAERFVNDDEANGLLSRPMRAPWKLPGH